MFYLQVKYYFFGNKIVLPSQHWLTDKHNLKWISSQTNTNKSCLLRLTQLTTLNSSFRALAISPPESPLAATLAHSVSDVGYYLETTSNTVEAEIRHGKY